MKTLEQQLASYGDFQKEIHGEVSVDELATVPRLSPPSRPRWGRWVAVMAAAVAMLLVGLLPALLRSGDETTPAATTPLTPTTVVTETTAVSAQPGSITWTLVDDANVDIGQWDWPDIGFTGDEYVTVTSCDMPQGRAELWSSSNGLSWTAEDVPCDTELISVEDSVVRTKDHSSPEVYFKEGGAPWREVRLLVGTHDGGPLHPRDTIWELDNSDLLFDSDFVLWDHSGGIQRVSWLFEFEEQFVGFDIAPNQEHDRMGSLVAHVTRDGSTWEEAAAPPFHEQGFVDGRLWSAFAHRDSTAIAVLSKSGERRMWRTVDGINWVDVTPLQLVQGGVWAGRDFFVQGLELWESDRSPNFLISTDGLNWTARSDPDSYADFKGVVRVAGNKIFVSGPEGLLVGTYTPDTAESP